MAKKESFAEKRARMIKEAQEKQKLSIDNSSTQVPKTPPKPPKKIVYRQNDKLSIDKSKLSIDKIIPKNIQEKYQPKTPSSKSTQKPSVDKTTLTKFTKQTQENQKAIKELNKKLDELSKLMETKIQATKPQPIYIQDDIDWAIETAIMLRYKRALKANTGDELKHVRRLIVYFFKGIYEKGAVKLYVVNDKLTAKKPKDV